MSLASYHCSTPRLVRATADTRLSLASGSSFAFYRASQGPAGRIGQTTHATPRPPQLKLPQMHTMPLAGLGNAGQNAHLSSGCPSKGTVWLSQQTPPPTRPRPPPLANEPASGPPIFGKGATSAP